MPGSYPSSPPMGPSNNNSSSHSGSSRALGATIQNAHYPNHHQRHSQHRHRRHHSMQTIMSAEAPQSALNTIGNNNRSTRSPRHSRDDNNVPQLRQPAPDLTIRFSEFVRSPRQTATSQHPVIESYIDNEDYQSLLAAVSSIRMSRPQHQQDTPRPDAADRVGSLEEQHSSGQVVTLPDDDEIDEQMLEVEEPEDNEEMYDSTSSSVIEDIYDLQHIMIHNQLEFENQMRRAREDYARHRDNALAEIEQNQEAANQNQSSDHPSSSYETLNSPGESMIPTGMEEPLRTMESHFNSPAEHYSNVTDNPRPTISSSYFSPTSESTIVLSSPPPGRSSTGVSQHNEQQETGRPSHNVAAGNMSSTAEALRFGNGPYRPFVTGRDINHQQQQQHDIQEQQQQQQYARQQGQPFSSYSGRRESEGGMNDPMDQDGNFVVVGENEGGQWSIYGSLTQSSNSFEQHRYQYYRQQQQHHQFTQDRNDLTAGGFPVVRPSVAQPTLRTNPTSYPIHLDATRRGPHAVAPILFANSGPVSPSSNIPIPSRYINPQPLAHPQYTSSFTATSTSSNFYRPNNIATGQAQYAYRRSNATNNYQLPSGPRQRAVNGPSQSYSETVERAEAGGWTPTSHTSAAGSTLTSRYDESLEYRERHNIGLKEVVRMACRFCETIICERGMKAQLLADQSVALLSTDDAPQSGNAIGYHITQPCDKCLNAENNGHLWLFHPEYILSCLRWDPAFMRPLRWGELPRPEQDFDTLSLGKVIQGRPNGAMDVGGMVRREYDAICR
ncbi:Protein fam72a [Linnemannia hyalina]|uniref:Protein fam72a n=1 Tax=Linnemannia hyalina TaxID=64524 RepID=A0A9P8BTV1_9FUNG|nr:Protein fam72a [Linnemannia hyalina]